MATVLSRDDFFQAITEDLPAEQVELIGANGKVRGVVTMRGLTVRELTEYQEKMTITLSSGQRKQNTKHAMALLIAMSAINPDGSPFFDPSDITRMETGAARAMMPLFESAQRLSGLTDEDVKELVGNFDETQNGSSASV